MLTLLHVVTFVLGGLCQSTGRSLRSHLRLLFFDNPRSPNPTIATYNKFSTSQILYSLASIAAVQLTMNFTVIPFMLLEVGMSWDGWRTLSYYGIYLVIIPFVAFQAGFGKSLDKLTGVGELKKKEMAAKGIHGSTNGNMQVVDVDVVGDHAVQKGKEAQAAVLGGKKDL